MTELVFKILGSALSIWESKEKTKYIDKLIKLEKDYYEEINKERPDHARIDVYLHELRLIGKAYYSQVGTENIKNK